MKKALLFLDRGYEGSFCGRFAKGLEGWMTSHLSFVGLLEIWFGV